MATVAVENAPPVPADSKSARKKKAKGDTTTAGKPSATLPAVPNGGRDESSLSGAKADGEGSQEQHEHPYLRDLGKQIRNINKKLLGTQKTDSVLAENPGVSLDDLVAAKKINLDQRNAILKKPHLKEQLEMLEAQMQHYRQFESDFQTKLTKQRDDFQSQHQVALAKASQEARLEAEKANAGELRRNLLVFSQFLRCAAHKRSVEEDSETDENRAFEGALLLVYGGDQKAVETAMKIINGSDGHVPSIEGIDLPVSYSQIKQASIDHAPYHVEETWVDQVAEATASGAGVVPAGSDPTIAHAGLTELDPRENGTANHGAAQGLSSVEATDASGNNAGERWNSTAPGTETGGLEESYEIVPRPQEEVDIHTGTQTDLAEGKTSWADEPSVLDASGATGNQAGERWDLKAAGDQSDNNWPTETTSRTVQTGGATVTEGDVDGDGFHQVGGRARGGRGGRGAEFRGRGGRARGSGRGDGEGRGRGGRGGLRGNRGGDRGDGEFRGRGRGRGGPRGGAAAAAATTAAAVHAARIP